MRDEPAQVRPDVVAPLRARVTRVSGRASVPGIRIDGLDVSKLGTRRDALAQAACRGCDTAMSIVSDAGRVHP